jgi:hypothetical protein
MRMELFLYQLKKLFNEIKIRANVLDWKVKTNIVFFKLNKLWFHKKKKEEEEEEEERFQWYSIKTNIIVVNLFELIKV